MSERPAYNEPSRQSAGAHFGGPRGGPVGALVQPVEKAEDARGTFARMITYLLPWKYRLAAVLIMAVGSTVFGIISPKILGLATTRLFADWQAVTGGMTTAGFDMEYIIQLLYILTGLYMASAAFSYAQQYVMAGIAQKTVYAMRQDVYARLSRLPLNYYDSRSHGDILSRVTNDLDNISSTLQQSLTQLLTALVTLVGVLIMMLTISPWMTLIYVAVLPLSALVTRTAARRSQNLFAAQQKSLGELGGHVEEMYTGHLIVKAFGREKESIEHFNSISNELYDSAWKAQFVSGVIMPLIGFINNIGYVLVCVMGGLLAARQAITVGDVQAFIMYARQFTQPIIQTANIANIIQSTLASAERVFQVIDEEEELPDPDQPVAPLKPIGQVRMEHVYFRYKPDIPLIEDMNIEARPGQTVAIVGPTGAGKTTLVNLLMRFYEIDQGKITVDGVDITDIPRGQLRSMYGMVLQDTWLFNGTIRDNIAFGKDGATEEEIVCAARTAHADHFIRTLPEGYDTVLNEEASNISQGQKQLLTIARAILADPVVLILDEATSNVDTRTEAYVQKAMIALMKRRTSFVIAHRLSTIRDADLILVMNNGRLIEKGRHEELIKRGGFYAELYNSQFVGLPTL